MMDSDRQQSEFDIYRRRLAWYLRIRWTFPFVAIAIFVIVLFAIPDNPPEKQQIMVMMRWVFGTTGTIVISALTAAGVYVRSLRYWIEGTTLRIDQGVLVRRQKSIPLDRITDIELVRGPLMLLFGIWSMRIQTAGSAQQAPEGVLAGVVDPPSARNVIMSARDAAVARTREHG